MENTHKNARDLLKATSTLLEMSEDAETKDLSNALLKTAQEIVDRVHSMLATLISWKDNL
jgi:hypothetical protein